MYVCFANRQAFKSLNNSRLKNCCVYRFLSFEPLYGAFRKNLSVGRKGPLVVKWFQKNVLYDLSKLEASKRNVLNPNLTGQAFKRIKLFHFHEVNVPRLKSGTGKENFKFRVQVRKSLCVICYTKKVSLIAKKIRSSLLFS